MCVCLRLFFRFRCLSSSLCVFLLGVWCPVLVLPLFSVCVPGVCVVCVCVRAGVLVLCSGPCLGLLVSFSFSFWPSGLTLRTHKLPATKVAPPA